MPTNPSHTHPHGKPVSRSTYANHRCRCNGCRQANAKYVNEQRKRKAARKAARGDAPVDAPVPTAERSVQVKRSFGK